MRKAPTDHRQLEGGDQIRSEVRCADGSTEWVDLEELEAAAGILENIEINRREELDATD